MAPPQAQQVNDVNTNGKNHETFKKSNPRTLMSSLRRLMGRSSTQLRDFPGSPSASALCQALATQQAEAIIKDGDDSSPSTSKTPPRSATSMPVLVPEAPVRSAAWSFPKIALSILSARKLPRTFASALTVAPPEMTLCAPPFSTGAIPNSFGSSESCKSTPAVINYNSSHKSFESSRPALSSISTATPTATKVHGHVTRHSTDLANSCTLGVISSSPPISPLHIGSFPAIDSYTTCKPVTTISSSCTFNSVAAGPCTANAQPPSATAAVFTPLAPSGTSSTASAAMDATLPSTLLALCSAAPGSMRRPVWRLSDYAITGRLYRGEVSSVYKAVCGFSKLKVVLKVYSLPRVPENALHTLVREVRIHADLVHDNILTMYGVFEEESRLVLVLERALRGDMFAVRSSLTCGRMSEDQVRVLILAPLLDALAYLHSKGVCHRDIKPENLLMTASWQLRLADFGAAINLTQERAVTRTGTMDYMAPEVERCPLKMLPEDNKDNPELAYSTAADVWSVGVLAYEMLMGFPPFINCSNRGQDDGAGGGGGGGRSGELCFPHFVSAGGQDFISSALAERPMDRPTAAQLLRHPWLKHAVRQNQMRSRGSVPKVMMQPQQQQQQQPSPDQNGVSLRKALSPRGSTLMAPLSASDNDKSNHDAKS